LFFKVAVVGIGTQIAPLANYRVAQKTIVCFVAVTKEDYVVQFATGFAVRT
jgi:hypothetical protein